MLRRMKTHFALGALALAFVQCSGQSTPQAQTPLPPPAEDPAAQPTVRGPGAPDNTATLESEAKPDNDTAATPAPDAAGSVAVKLNDEQIAAITDGANSAEVEQATLARTKTKTGSVQRFAGMMIAHHGEAQKKQAKLKLKTAESVLSQQMLEENNKTLALLKEKTGTDFDQAYFQAQVDGHRKVLESIDRDLLPNVKNPELKAYIDEIRPKVEQHLQAAREAQEALPGKKQAAAAK